MIFDLRNDVVSLSEEALSIPEFKTLSEMKKDEYQKIIDYIYFVYDKRSPYYSVLISDRKALVSWDRLKDKKIYKKLEKTPDTLLAIAKFNLINSTPAERLLEGANKKIEEYLKFWNDTPISSDNHKLIADTLENANSLIKLRNTLQSQVMNETQSRNVGGSEAKLFEDS
jgi:hypothetical protein